MRQEWSDRDPEPISPFEWGLGAIVTLLGIATVVRIFL
ncbi:hypothetical protein CP98_03918 [Sphingobium yanoikuyae]|uniref:Uncharacterized protein n=1 Tax=Sphingobium yanoikuyae TaxID=13690 RepID=A0A084EFF1_SPHYA|nr:hypothetical protein CP98_03918 [Sphingobium yanoikuyae]